MSAGDNITAKPLNRLLKLAILAGVESAIRIHIRRGDDLNARDSNGLTPLMLAATKGRAAVCRLLVVAGADHTLLDPLGRNAVAIAKARGEHLTVEAIEAAVAELAKQILPTDSIQIPKIPSTTAEHQHATEFSIPVSPLSVEIDQEEPSSPEAGAHHLPQKPVITAFQLNIEFGGDKESEGSSPAQSTIDIASEASPIDPGAGGIHDSELISGLEKCGMKMPRVQEDIVGWVDTPHETFEVEVDDEDSFDLSGWEEEMEVKAPRGDETIAESAAVVNQNISAHIPIDNTVDWEGFDDFLPEFAAPVIKDRTGDGRQAIRNIILRAIHEGAVPDLLVRALFEKEDGGQGEQVEQGEAVVRLILRDLGAVTDERIELSDAGYEPEEDEAEEHEISAAMTFMDDLVSGQNDPMRLYFRDIGTRVLLTAEEEVALSRDMEEGIVQALDALAAWPQGIERLLSFADRMKAGEIKADAISSAHDEKEPSDGDTQSIIGEDDENTTDASHPDEVSSVVAVFLARMNEIALLSDHAGRGGLDEEKLRGALAAIGFSRAVLAEIAVITGEQEAAAGRFAEAINRAEQARERMIFCNLRLAASIARRYQGAALPLEDLVQEANIGLMKAVERYDWRRGFRFSTYATWWIKQQITRAIADKARTIRLPYHIVEAINKMNRIRGNLFHKNGYEANIRALAAAMEMPDHRIRMLLKISEDALSMDMPEDPEAEAFLETLVDSRNRDPVEAVIEDNLRVVVWEALEGLKPQEKEILVLRYGLASESDCEHTLEEVGQMLGVTRERIRQIQAKALERLRHPERSGKLRTFSERPDSSTPRGEK